MLYSCTHMATVGVRVKAVLRDLTRIGLLQLNLRLKTSRPPGGRGVVWQTTDEVEPNLF